MSSTWSRDTVVRPVGGSELRVVPAWTSTLAVTVALLVMGWYALVRGARVPLLGLFDLGIHELGHLVSYPLPVPRIVEAVAGSAAQILVPLGLALYFARVVGDRDGRQGAAFCAGWAASSMVDVSVYVADAPHQRLTLIGGHHDWAYILGPRGLNHLEWAGSIAGGLRTTALGIWLVSLAVVAGPPLLGRLVPSGED